MRSRLLLTIGCLASLSTHLLGLGVADASALDDIRKRGELIIATDATYPPFEYKDQDTGVLQGFDIDLGRAIGKELGVKTRWLPIEWAGVFAALTTHKADLVLSGVTITDERKKGNAFSRPYFLSGQAVTRRRGDTRIQSSKDLLDKIVAVQHDTTGQKAAEEMGVPKDRIHRFDTLQDGLMDVRNKKADAAIADMPALQDNLRKGYSELEIVGGIFVHEHVGVVLRRGEPELLAAVNQALSHILTDGRYAQSYQKWIREPLPASTLPELERIAGEGTPATETAGGSAIAIRWDLLGRALPLLIRAAGMTLYITLLTLLIGVPVGLLIALLRVSGVRLLRAAATVYVEVVRGTPLLMQIYVIYFVLPELGLNLPQLASAVAALSLNAAAYISEIFRAGIESIDAGQMEAARSLGMDYSGAMRWVILPQTLRRVLPPLTNEAVALLKDSSLVSVIALSELMRAGKETAINTGSPTTIYFAVALIYLAMTLPLTQLVRYLETRWQPISRPRKEKKLTVRSV